MSVETSLIFLSNAKIEVKIIKENTKSLRDNLFLINIKKK